MTTSVGTNIVRNGLVLNADLSNRNSFSGLATTNRTRQDSNYTGTQYGDGDQWAATEPSLIVKTYIPSVKTPIGTGATLITESGQTGYHHLTRYGGSGNSFLHSISCYIKPLEPVTEFCIGYLVDPNSGANFNLSTKAINSEGVVNNNYFIYEVDGYPGWLRLGVNIEGRTGGWVGALGYKMTSYASTAGAKPCYITGIQYEYTTTSTNFITSQGTRTNTVAGGGGVKNLMSSSNSATIVGSDLTQNNEKFTSLKFSGSTNQSADFGTINFGTTGSKEATVEYIIKATTSGAWNHFGQGGPGYYYAINPSNQLIAMVSAKDASNNDVNFWPTTSNLSSTLINKNAHITFVMKEDTYAKWYVNGVLQLTSTPPFFGFMRFKDVSFKMGQSYYTDGTTQFNGNIYSLRVWNRVLSDAEIAQNFNAVRGRYGI